MKKEVFKMLDTIIGDIQTVKKLYRAGKYRDAYKTVEEILRGRSWRLFDYIESAYIREFSDKSELTEEEKKKILELNSTLSDLEKRINREAEKIAVECDKRIGSPEEEFLKDYEIEFEVQYFLREDDLAYNEEGDNILANFSHNWSKEEKIVLETGYNWNEMAHMEQKEETHHDYHCWLFHELYDHARPRLTKKDLLRIGSVWVDVRLIYQHCFGLKDGKKVERILG